MVQIVGEKNATLAAGKPSIARAGNTVRDVGEEVTPRSPSVELADAIASHLWKQLWFARVADETGHRGIEHVVRIASSSHEQVTGWYRDLQKFADAILAATVEVQGDRLSTEYQGNLVAEIKKEIIADDWFPIPPQSFVDYQFADREPEVAIHESVTHLKSQCLTIANHFVGLLDHLRDANIVGEVATAKETCRFSFHNRIAIVRKSGETRRKVDRKLDPEFADHWHKAYITDTYEITDAKVLHQKQTRIHHIRNPAIKTPEKTKYPVPAKYRELIESIPDCIRPLVRVLEGDLFREEGIDWDFKLEERPHTKLLSSEWSRCPAILLGDYVLAGWGELSIADQEQSNFESKQLELEAKADIGAKRFSMAAVIGGVCSVFIMAASLLSANLLTPLAILLGVGSMYLFAQSTTKLTSIIDTRSAQLSLWRVTRFGCVVFAFQAALFAVLNASLIALFLALLLGVAALLIRKQLPNLQRSWR
tara:strand:- start:6957 stop:8393 length:1437 start_codon:yes stop_codon:yes gene_type:complete